MSHKQEKDLDQSVENEFEEFENEPAYLRLEEYKG